MKKLNLIWITGLFASLGVYAAPDVPKVVGDVFNALIDLFKILLHGGPADPGNAGLMTQLLFFVIILAVVHIAMGRIDLFKEKPNSALLVSLAVSLLATRYIHLADEAFRTNILEFLLLPYGAMGIGITVLIPIFVYAAFIKGFDSIFRKIGWALLAVVFLTFWWIRNDQLGDLSWIYFFAAVLSIALLFMDGTIQRALNKASAERAYEGTMSVEISALNQDRNRVAKLLAREHDERERDRLEKQLDTIERRLGLLRRRRGKI